MTAAVRTTAVWAGLSAITVVSWFLAPAHHAQPVAASTPITLGVLALAVIKTRLIIQEFMEVRTAPLWLRLATDGWLVALFGAIVVSYVW
ncbi:cytochrome C oxidase subunit IV family protein [Mycobacterium sp. HM-7]